MPDFLDNDIIKIQPTTRNRPVPMTFAACSSATAKDGSIPYGDTIASAVVKAYSPDGTDVTSSMVTQAASVNGLTVTCDISYYTGVATGRHKLTCILTMASGYVDEFDLKRVEVADT